MNKVTGSILGLAGAAVVGSITLLPLSNTTSLQDALHASVQLENYCSATVIPDPNKEDGVQLTAITAKHCLDKNQGIGTVLTINIPTIVGNDYGKLTPVKVIIKDVSKESDLVLLQGMSPESDPKIPAISVYGGLPTTGTWAYAFGYPRAESLTVSPGLLNYVVTDGSFPGLSLSGLWQKSTNATQGGSSGGGLMIETDNGFELVGVLTWGYRTDEGAAYWTPVSEIRKFLEENSGK